MWDWYNRPGGINRVPTWKLVVVMIIAGILTTLILWVLYALLAGVLFRPIVR